MTYDDSLGERIRSILSDRTDVTERKMFGGLASESDLGKWVKRAAEFVLSLPPK